MFPRIARALSTHVPRRVEFRSDTFTLPTAGMLDRALRSPLGDDVYGEDPTVNELERYGARLLGKAAALFVPSGTMGNLLAIGAHCRRGSEVICGNLSHIFNYEAGGAAVLMSASLNPLQNLPDGTLDLAGIRAAFRPDDSHYSVTSLVALENTHNMSGGTVLPMAYVEAVASICREHKVPLHMDGARLMNAAVALGCTPAEIAKPADSVSLCLSKGLGAPIGSLLLGSEEVVAAARRLRKMVGGGMRQAGLIAGPALYALENNIPRLALDHQRARRVAELLRTAFGELTRVADLPSELSADSAVCVKQPSTNIVNLVFAKAETAKLFLHLMRQEGVLMGGGYSPTIVRLVTHLNVSDEDIHATEAALGRVVKQLFKGPSQ